MVYINILQVSISSMHYITKRIKYISKVYGQTMFFLALYCLFVKNFTYLDIHLKIIKKMITI